MLIKKKLQIILITYNRAKYVENTLSQFFCENSPVQNCDFLILDNNSTDNTVDVARKWQSRYPNIKYQKNKYNVGISGNILKAMEIVDKDYVWIIGDDDIYDFSNWSEVEKAIENDEKIICVSRYVLPDDKKDDVAWQLLQLTFITGGIYSTSLFNDITMRNAYDNIYTLFPHLLPIVDFINDDNKIYVASKAISDNGMHLEEKDVSYSRGVKNIHKLSKRTQNSTWLLGYCDVISSLYDKKLISRTIECAISYPDIFKNLEEFYQYIEFLENNHKDYFYSIYSLLCENRKLKYRKYLDSKKQSGGYDRIVINIFGIKIKFRKRHVAKNKV